jgi:hypothetical protein
MTAQLLAPSKLHPSIGLQIVTIILTRVTSRTRLADLYLLSVTRSICIPLRERLFFLPDPFPAIKSLNPDVPMFLCKLPNRRRKKKLQRRTRRKVRHKSGNCYYSEAVNKIILIII